MCLTIQWFTGLQLSRVADDPVTSLIFNTIGGYEKSYQVMVIDWQVDISRRARQSRFHPFENKRCDWLLSIRKCHLIDLRRWFHGVMVVYILCTLYLWLRLCNHHLRALTRRDVPLPVTSATSSHGLWFASIYLSVCVFEQIGSFEIQRLLLAFNLKSEIHTPYTPRLIVDTVS
jgi:hypothetical protein